MICAYALRLLLLVKTGFTVAKKRALQALASPPLRIIPSRKLLRDVAVGEVVGDSLRVAVVRIAVTAAASGMKLQPLTSGD